ncbi:MAG: hypothetical protein ABIJ46_04890 [bacterium]
MTGPITEQTDMTRNRKLKLTAATALTGLLSWPTAVALADTGLGVSGGVSGQTELSSSLPTIVGGVIGVLLGVVGVVFFVLMIYSGFLWMTAAGNEDQIKKARTLIFQAIVGMVIVFAAYGITEFVVGTIGLEDGGSWTIESSSVDTSADGDDSWTMYDDSGNVIDEGDPIEALLGEESAEDFDQLLNDLAN